MPDAASIAVASLAFACIAGVSLAARAEPAPAARSRFEPQARRIDLSRAGAEEIATLGRIGPALAARIVADRAARGPFRSVEDLARVPGIGEATLEAIRPDAVVGEP